MLNIEIAKGINNKLVILCLGAHSDDIEIGCGGTILRLLSDGFNIDIHWVVFGSNGRRNGEAALSAKYFLAGSKKNSVIIKNFKDGYFQHQAGKIKFYFEKLKNNISPDIIFSHYRHDLHQDHRIISELTWNTFRDHLILEYEVIKYDGDIGSPNLYFNLSEDICKNKVDYIMKAFKSQKYKHWFTEDSFMSILRIRGIESRSPGKYAEGFYGRKLVI